MLIKIKDKVTDPKEEIIAIIFEDPKEVRKFATYLLYSVGRNNEMRVWCAYPDNIKIEEAKEFVKDYI